MNILKPQLLIRTPHDSRKSIKQIDQIESVKIFKIKKSSFNGFRLYYNRLSDKKILTKTIRY